MEKVASRETCKKRLLANGVATEARLASDKTGKVPVQNVSGWVGAIIVP